MSTRTLARSFAGAAFGLAALALGACSQTYILDVQNRTSQPVELRVFEGRSNVLLGPVSVGPLDSEEFTVETTAKSLSAEADVAGNRSFAASETVYPGRTLLEVLQTDARSTTEIRLVAKQANPGG